MKDTYSNSLKLQIIFDDLTLVEKEATAHNLSRIESQLDCGNIRSGSARKAVKDTDGGSRLVKVWKDNTPHLDYEIKQRLRHLLEKSTPKESVCLEVSGEQITNKELIMKRKLVSAYVNKDESSFTTEVVECHSLPPASEQNISTLSKVLSALEAPAKGDTSALAVEIENLTFEKRMNMTSILMEKAGSQSRAHRRNILNGINYVWNVACAIQRSVAEGYQKLRELKVQLHQVKEGISMLGSGTSTCSAFKGEETKLAMLNARGREGFLVQQAQQTQRSTEQRRKNVSDNTSTRAKALLEKAQLCSTTNTSDFDCTKRATPESNLNVMQLFLKSDWRHRYV
ncbi:hypothetical protein ERJ75_001806300 [Trypanosoma vivax]|nr:hypothetical protein ERJ75_001806300 [Trypanosoma vivax]